MSVNIARLFRKILPVTSIAMVGIGFTALSAPRTDADSNEKTVISYTTGSPLALDAPKNWGTRYSRVIRLRYSGSANGQLIATFESWPADLGIYRSTDDGLTWTKIAPVVEKHTPGWNFRVEPDLLELPCACGNLPAGTILLAANAGNGGKAHQLEIQYSTDHGLTWNFRGVVDDNRSTPGGMWEPNLGLTSSGQLICYYSDERFQSEGYNQLLGERVSPDGGLTWGKEIYACAIPGGAQRPGMAVVKKLPNGQYVMSFETGGTWGSQVHIKFSRDGVNWGSGPGDYGIPVQNAKGAFIGGTPYIMWMPGGGSKGTLCLTASVLTNTPNVDREMFLNYDLGKGDWTEVPCPVQWQGGDGLAGWSCGMIPTADGTGVIQLASSITGHNVCQMFVARETIVRPGDSYAVINANSGLAVGIPNNTRVRGTRLRQCAVKKSAAQRWVLNDLGNNVWTITNPGNGLAWDDAGWFKTPDSFVDQYDLNGLAVQQWRLSPVGDGTWKFVNVNSNLAMAVSGASTSVDAKIAQEVDNGARDCDWTLKDPGTPRR